MLRINVNNSEPIAQQVANGMREAIAGGELRVGDALPSARELATALDIHWNTVSRAYRQLAKEGLIDIAHGRRASVANQRRRDTGATKAEIDVVRKCLRQALTRARLCGIRRVDFEALLREEGQDLGWGRAT